MHRALAFALASALVLGSAQAAPNFSPTQAAGGNWTLPAGDYSATRFSRLDGINARNVSKLHPVWDFAAGVFGGYEGQPLVVHNTLYVVTPWPDVLYAFDLTKPGYPLKWKFRPNVGRNGIGHACCEVVDRGAVYADGKIIYNLLDGHTIAVDAVTGKLLWKTRVANVAKSQTMTMAPLVVRNRVIVGVSGGEFGVRGFVKALDLQSGRVVWTAYNDGPESSMLIDPKTFKSPYGIKADAGVKSWPKNGWKHSGGPVWGWIAYDPKLDLIYYGTGNPDPWNASQRPGDNKWTCSVLARRPETGQLVWAYQFTPHDGWDYDSTGAMILANLTIHGKPVKALVHFDKNGFAYTLNRATGKPLVAAQFAPVVNWAKSIDLKTGRPVVNPAKQTGSSQGKVKQICPSSEGGVNPASPGAYSPLTHLFYTSINNLCMNYKVRHEKYLQGTPDTGVSNPMHPGPGGFAGGFLAWNAATGKKVWEKKFPFPNWSGALATAGNLVFFGTLDGYLEAANARSGRILWKFKVGSGVVGCPIAFRGPDGREYIAVYAGMGGDMGDLAGDIRSRNPDDLRPKNKMIPQLARYTSQGDLVWIFRL